MTAIAALTFAVAALAAPPPASSFVAEVDNEWFPLAPGTTYVYTGRKDGQPSRDVFTVTRRTKRIEGVRCSTVDDRLYLSGRLAERTEDWYAQDRDGNVWYFGEATEELDRHGKVKSREGSWQAGVGGAQAGIYMPGRPYVGATGLQELYRGHAEDHFRVLSIAADRVLLAKEWTPLEPGVVDHKLYVRGIGMVQEEAVAGGDERATLVAVRHSG